MFWCVITLRSLFGLSESMLQTLVFVCHRCFVRVRASIFGLGPRLVKHTTLIAILHVVVAIAWGDWPHLRQVCAAKRSDCALVERSCAAHMGVVAHTCSSRLQLTLLAAQTCRTCGSLRQQLERKVQSAVHRRDVNNICRAAHLVFPLDRRGGLLACHLQQHFVWRRACTCLCGLLCLRLAVAFGY
jgi:hypothetical protein